MRYLINYVIYALIMYIALSLGQKTFNFFLWGEGVGVALFIPPAVATLFMMEILGVDLTRWD